MRMTSLYVAYALLSSFYLGRRMRSMRRKIFRITPDEETNLRMMIQFVIKHHHLSPELPNGEEDKVPNESTILRALIKLGHDVALNAVALKMSPDKAVEITFTVDEMTKRLYSDGHFDS
ncbi:MAG: hypothetical protein ABJM75_07710 [Luteolibacter sp.]